MREREKNEPLANNLVHVFAPRADFCDGSFLREKKIAKGLLHLKNISHFFRSAKTDLVSGW